MLKTSVSKFIPNTPATTPKIATMNVAVVSSSSNWISWFRTLSWGQEIQDTSIGTEQHA
jgi:hypothetical protein